MLVFGHPTVQSLLIGTFLAAIGEGARSWGVAYAGSLTRVTGTVGAPSVIMAGPYAYLRNPLYVGNILLYVGVALASNALSPWFPLVAVVVFGVQYAVIVSLEEEFLEKEFGTGYLEYKKNVPRFVPRLSAYRSSAQVEQTPRWREALRSETRTLQAIGLVYGVLIVLWVRG
jgi:protein-S-isoprenylcysteine O-methyltransferase Ste14